MQREYDRMEWRCEYWIKRCNEIAANQTNYKKLYEKQQKVIDSLKELFT